MLPSCTFGEPPGCSDEQVDALVRQRLAEDPAAAFDARIDRRDPLSRARLAALGVGMHPSGRFAISEERAGSLVWTLSNHRSTGINREVGIRSCSADVSYGTSSETVGRFPLHYTVGNTDDGRLYVQLID
jgi:hypothetical protein